MSRRWTAAERRALVAEVVALIIEDGWSLRDTLTAVAHDHRTHAAVIGRILQDHGYATTGHAAFLNAVRDHAASKLAARAAKAKDLDEVSRLAHAARAIGGPPPTPKKSEPTPPRSPLDLTRRAHEIKRNLDARKAAAR